MVCNVRSVFILTKTAGVISLSETAYVFLLPGYCLAGGRDADPGT